MAVLQRVDRGELKLDQQVKVEPRDFVRKGMYSPVRDKYPDGTELTIAELLRYTICESDGSTSDVLMKLIGGPGSIMAFLEAGIGTRSIGTGQLPKARSHSSRPCNRSAGSRLRAR